MKLKKQGFVVFCSAAMLTSSAFASGYDKCVAVVANDESVADILSESDVENGCQCTADAISGDAKLEKDFDEAFSYPLLADRAGAASPELMEATSACWPQ